VVKRRNRLIYFRISEGEFENYTRLCESSGARSISDLARSAVNRMLVASEAAPSYAAMTDEIARLNKQLETVTRLLRVKVRPSRSGRKAKDEGTDNACEL
jgi:hypothetical protein